MSRIICIANQKGGVGKTTTSVNLASSLAAAEKRVLLVDIDPQANATSGVGIDKNSLKSSIYDLIINDENPAGLLLETELKSLQLMPATPDLAGAGRAGRHLRQDDGQAACATSADRASRERDLGRLAGRPSQGREV